MSAQGQNTDTKMRIAPWESVSESTAQDPVVPQMYGDRWGFAVLHATMNAGSPSGTWVARDEGVQWAMAHVDGPALKIFSWYSLFLDCLSRGIALPSVGLAADGVVPRWILARHESLVNTYLADLPESGRPDPSLVFKFLDDWADDFIRAHAPKLESRQMIGGPLGRRYLARLLRVRQPWEVNAGDRTALIRTAQAWLEEAQSIDESEPTAKEGIAVRISGIATGEDLVLEVLAGDGVLNAAEEVAGWALRWDPWRRALSSEGLRPIRLNFEEAEGFWHQEVPVLSAAGIRLEFPRHWRRPQLTVRGEVVKSGTDNPFAVGSLAEVDWNVAVDGEPITVEELRRLAHANAPMVKVRNTWVVADSVLIERARLLYERVRQRRLRREELLRLHIDQELTGVQLEDGGSVRAAIAALSETPTVTLPIPGFTGTLRPYQIEGVGWLRQRMQLSLGALLADDMGLGKTVEVIAALADYFPQWKGPVLLVCPLSVVSNWEHEFGRFFPKVKVAMHLGLGRHGADGFAQWASQQSVILTTYDVLARDAQFLKDVAWTGIVADEAQHLKNHRTKRARALRQLTSDWRIALTGTPVENRLSDLWSEMDVLNPGYLGSEADFRQEFERPITRSRDADAVARLQRLLEPFVLRRVKTDPTILPDLPDKVEVKEWTGITREQAMLYQSVVDNLWDEMNQAGGRNPMARRGIILTALTHLKQIVNHPESYAGKGGALKSRSGKLTRLEDLLQDILDVKEKVVIFTQYVRMGELLKPYLSRKFHTPVAFFHGGLNKMERDRMLEQLRSADGPSVLIASLRAGGVGLNLVHAQHVIHYDRWWNPAIEDQATDRVWRIGQTKLVSVHKLITRGTLEERIDRVIESKRRISQTVMAAGDGDRWLTELTDQEIRDLVELGDDAWIAGD